MKSKKKHCLVCQRISRIKNSTNPYFVKELETGYVVLGDHQYYQGYTLFLCKKHVPELHDLSPDYAVKFLKDLMLVAKVVWQAFKPEKLNYELLGNSHSHLHWHIFPRYKDDPKKSSTIWSLSPRVRYAKKYQPNEEELKKLKKRLTKFLLPPTS